MTIEWRYTDDQGVEHAVPTDELRASVAGGTVAPSTLVWREGMKEWAPAFTVPELVPVLTGNRRGPIHTLSGIEPELMADALGKSADAGSITEPTVDDPGAAPAAARRDLAAITDDAEGWGDATDVIPKAPGVPADAARNLPPRIHRRLPSLPPPPLPNIPTPPPPAVAPKVAERRQTLTGTGHRNSKPPLPPRRASIPPGLATSTEAAARPPRSEAPVPAQRRASVPPPPPRRLNKSLGPEAKPESLPPAVAAARTLVSPSSRTGAAPEASKGGAVVPRIGRTTALGLGAKQSTPPPANKLALTATPAPVQAASAQPPGTLTPTVLAQLPPVPAASSGPIAAPSPASASASAPAPAAGAGAGKSKELTEASSAFAAEMEKSRAAFSAEMRKSNLAKTSKGTGDPPAEPIPRSPTLEMAAVDHSQAAAKDPNSPDMPPANPAPIDDEATAPIQVAKIVAEGERARARKKEALAAREEAAEAEALPASVEGSPTAASPASTARPSRAPSRRGGKEALEVPLSSLVAASALWVLGLVAFFFAGRVSGVSSAGAAPLAKDGIAKAFLVWSSAHAATAGPSDSEPKPCWVTRQPSKWVATASKSVPVDMRARDTSSIELGFAAEDHVAVGLRIDPRTGKPEEVFRKQVDAKITRVTPTGSGEGFLVNEEGAREYLPISGTPPLFVSFDSAALGIVDAPGGDPTSLWTFDTPGEVSAATVVDTGGDYALTFRKDDAVWAGYFGKDKVARGALGRLTGSEGGKSGKPRSSFNGKEIAITFADKSSADGATYDIRLGRAPLGSLPTSTEIIKIPEGGPGGNAISPDLIGLPDGRWLLMWTEGRSGAWAIRAQTYNATMEPIGDPIALSPPAGSFGQAVLGVVGSYTTVAFLQAHDEGFELWGAVLQCGS